MYGDLLSNRQEFWAAENLVTEWRKPFRKLASDLSGKSRKPDFKTPNGTCAQAALRLSLHWDAWDSRLAPACGRGERHSNPLLRQPTACTTNHAQLW